MEHVIKNYICWAVQKKTKKIFIHDNELFADSRYLT